MDTRTYFTFESGEHSFPSSVQGGYLSFLPENYHYGCTEDIQYISFELEHMVLLEIKMTAPDSGLRLNLLNENIGLWQLYQFRNNTEVFLPHSMLLTDNRGMTFASKGIQIPLFLQGGKQWMVCVGYKRTAMPLLMQEYGEKLHELQAYFLDEKAFHYRDVDFAIGHRFRDLFSHMGKQEYQAFSCSAETTLVFSRLFSLYCQQLQPNGQSYLSLYHKALEYIREHAGEKISKRQIAEALLVSTRTLNRAFEDKPYKIADYIQRVKLNRAKEMLFTEDKSVDKVAEQLHYPNRRYFGRAFKKYFVQTPTAIQNLGELYYKPSKEEDKGWPFEDKA